MKAKISLILITMLSFSGIAQSSKFYSKIKRMNLNRLSLRGTKQSLILKTTLNN